MLGDWKYPALLTDTCIAYEKSLTVRIVINLIRLFSKDLSFKNYFLIIVTISTRLDTACLCLRFFFLFLFFSFFEREVHFMLFQWVPCTIYGTHKSLFSAKLSLKMSFTVLFTHKNYFTIVFSVFNKITDIQTHPKWRSGKIQFVLSSIHKEDQIISLKYNVLNYKVKRFHEQKMHLLKLLLPTLTENKALKCILSNTC